MHYELMFPGKFLKSAELGDKDHTVTIAKVELEDLPAENGEIERRGVVTFRESKKQWLINRTNAECLKGMFGKETAAWIGKRVVLYSSPVRMMGEDVTGVRVRGSPDLAADKSITVRLPLKKPFTVTMRATKTPPPKAEDPAP